MGKVAVTIEWLVVYLIGFVIVFGLMEGAMTKDAAHKSNWVEIVMVLLLPVGIGLIVWQGTHGNLPGMAGSGRHVWPFLARFMAWAGGLSVLVGGIGALLGYFAMRSGSTHSTGEGIIVVIPATIGFLVGGLAGAIVTIVKTMRG